MAKSGFDAEQNKVIHEVKICDGDNKTEIWGGVYQYGDDLPKVGVTRWYWAEKNGKQEQQPSKLGRLSVAEAQALLEHLPDFIKRAKDATPTQAPAEKCSKCGKEAKAEDLDGEKVHWDRRQCA